jgi:hypothetical protein
MRYILLLLISTPLYAKYPLAQFIPNCIMDVQQGWEKRDQHVKSGFRELAIYPSDKVLTKYCICIYKAQDYYPPNTDFSQVNVMCEAISGMYEHSKW